MSKKRILITSTALLVLLWVFFGLAELRQADDNNQILITNQIDAIERELNQLTFVPKLLSNDPTIVQAALISKVDNPGVVGQDFELASIRLKETQVATGLEFSFLLNQQGMTIAASNWQDPISFIGQSYSFRPYFKQAITGSGSTYYAVGATTGIPGYFIAEPVQYEDTTLGVVVAKVSLDSVARSWGIRGTETIVIDEYGAVILSSDPSYLYQSTIPFSDAAIHTVKSERRYGPYLFSGSDASQPQVMSLSNYQIKTRDIAQTPWNMMVLLPEPLVAMRAFYKAVATFAVLLIAWLLYSLYQQQRRVVEAEQRVSRELEQQVFERTLELEDMQKTMIAESNFAMLGRMSAAINHEVNQPLATLRLNLASLRSLFKEPRLSDESLLSVQQIVTDSDLTTKRIARVITSLRSYARQNRVDSQKINVHELLVEVRSTINTERPNKAELIRYDIGEDLPPINGDTTLLQQGILNLLYNAFDAVLEVEEPYVVVCATRKKLAVGNKSTLDEYILISVSDNGDGISEDVRESLFEPFTTNRLHSGGLGLGLTITQQIIESHEGQLSYQSNSEGSQFTIQLPVTA